MFEKIINFLKLKKVNKNIDNKKRKSYTKKQVDREPLIREMFPSIELIGEYKNVNLLFELIDFRGTSIFIKAIGEFYWAEVNRLTLEGKYSEIEKYQGLIEFAQSLKDYQEFVVQAEILRKQEEQNI